jgi:hypothetical protein
MAPLQQLPVGTSDFERIRKNGALYVDKTRHLPELPKMGSVVFCARPRRFGKSLTVSTLEAFFSGKKDLFEGLAVEEYMHLKEFQPRPVIKLDMSTIANFYSRDELRDKLLHYLQDIAQNFYLTLRAPDPELAFNFLMKDLSKKAGSDLVVLIDEYDAPVINTLSEPMLLEDARKVMRGFYTQIKAADEHIHFAFITGVSKFSKMGVFSSLNNLYDISLDPEFSAMMGYTHEEFENYFQPYLNTVARKSGISVEKLPEMIRDYYNGFSFDGETRVYNPFSTLSLLTRGVFDNFWVESGSTSLIRNFLKDKELTIEQFRNLPVQRAFLTSPGEIESTPARGFLYQTGYLTLRKVNNDYYLDYPNFEVLSAMSSYCIQNVINNDDFADDLFKNARDAVAQQNPQALIKVINRVYAAIPYDDHRFGNKNEEQHKHLEFLYRAPLLTFLLGAGIRAQAEVHNNLGRMDIVAQCEDKTVVIEVKYAADASKARKEAEEGMRQMRERQYGNAYTAPLLLTIAIDESKRQIGAHLYELPDTRRAASETKKS